MIDELYQELILDHGKTPRNFHKCESPTNTAVGFNRICGDKIQIFAEIEAEKYRDLSFIGEGCAICMGSSSLLIEHCKRNNLDPKQTLALIDQFIQDITDVNSKQITDLKLSSLMGVRKFPTRVKCATLAWHTLRSALTNGKLVTTE